jgi:hypothetical protein
MSKWNSNSIEDKRAASVSNIGLIIAAAASLALLALAAYKIPLFNHELHGTIIGISEVHDHNETGSKLIAAVQLDTGAQVLVSMPDDFLKSDSVNVMVNEGRTLFGRKSYSIIAYNN